MSDGDCDSGFRSRLIIMILGKKCKNMREPYLTRNLYICQEGAVGCILSLTKGCGEVSSGVPS